MLLGEHFFFIHQEVIVTGQIIYGQCWLSRMVNFLGVYVLFIFTTAWYYSISELPPHVYRHTAATGDREIDLNLFSGYFTASSVCRAIMEWLKEFAGNLGEV